MNKLDRFSKFELFLYDAFVPITTFFGPVATVILMDHIWLNKYSYLVRISVWIFTGIITMMVLLAVIGQIEEIFKWIRKILGMRSISKITEEISDAEIQEEMKRDDRQKNRYISSPEEERLYLLWQTNQAELKCMKDIKNTVEKIYIVLFTSLIILVLMKILGKW